MSGKKLILIEGFYTIVLAALVSGYAASSETEESVSTEVEVTEVKVVAAKQHPIHAEAKAYSDFRESLYIDLDREFSGDMKRWGASLEEGSLTMTFNKDSSNSPVILFEAGSEEPTAEYRKTIREFCPRYYTKLKPYLSSNEIAEINIGGHTSSEWNGEGSWYRAWQNNMKLSQSRSLRVLEECSDSIAKLVIANGNTDSDVKNFHLFRKKLTANGYSSNFVKKNGGEEDRNASRRVEFSIQTSFDSRLVNL